MQASQDSNTKDDNWHISHLSQEVSPTPVTEWYQIIALFFQRQGLCTIISIQSKTQKSLPSKVFSIAQISRSSKSVMKYLGRQFGFHSFTFCKPSWMFSLFSLATTNEATIEYPMLVLTQRKKRGMSYLDVLYVASSKQISLPYFARRSCCHFVWCTNNIDPVVEDSDPSSEKLKKIHIVRVLCTTN